MRMLNDPVSFRPFRRSSQGRDFVISDRQKGSVYLRGFKRYTPLKTQLLQGSPKNSAVHNDDERGLPKFTPYTKKLSVSLLRPDGKIKHFTGTFPYDYMMYQPVGFLYDVNQLHQKQEKYVFEYDVGTSSKFWVGKTSVENLDTKEGRRSELSIENLKLKLQTDAQKDFPVSTLPFHKMQHASNEMVMGLKKSAIQALFATQDTPETRLRTLLHAIYLKQDYGIQVPLLIIDGKQSPKGYKAEQFKADLEALSFRSQVKKDLSLCFFSKKEYINIKRLNLNHLIYQKSHAYIDLI
jgi:hypothetical protein